MITSASVLAEIMFQAAVAVGHHANNTPLSALREGCLRTFGHKGADTYDAWLDARGVYVYCMGQAWDVHNFHMEGPSWGFMDI